MKNIHIKIARKVVLIVEPLIHEVNGLIYNQTYEDNVVNNERIEAIFRHLSTIFLHNNKHLNEIFHILENELGLDCALIRDRSDVEERITSIDFDRLTKMRDDMVHNLSLREPSNFKDFDTKKIIEESEAILSLIGKALIDEESISISEEKTLALELITEDLLPLLVNLNEAAVEDLVESLSPEARLLFKNASNLLCKIRFSEDYLAKEFLNNR